MRIEPGERCKCIRNMPPSDKITVSCTPYLRKINASPATNLFELTKTLQPVVSRCRLGCPENKTQGDMR
jgi:hypothetical protein